METIKSILIRRDGMSTHEADELIEMAKNEFNDSLEIGDLQNAEEICMNYFGLEPDYIDELL